MTPTLTEQAERLGLDLIKSYGQWMVRLKMNGVMTALIVSRSEDKIAEFLRNWKIARSSTIEEVAAEFTNKTFTIEYHHVDGNHIAKHIRSLK